MEKNIITINTMVNNIVNRTIMATKQYLKYICAVLMMIGTSASAWAARGDRNLPIEVGTLEGCTYTGPAYVEAGHWDENVELTFEALPGYSGEEVTINVVTGSENISANQYGGYAFGWNDGTLTLTLYADYFCNPDVSRPIKYGSNITINLSFTMSGGFEIEYSTNGCSGSVEGPAQAIPGATVNMTITPGSGCELASVYVLDENDNEPTPSGSGSSWSFTMGNANTMVEVTFQAAAVTRSITYNKTLASCATNWPSNVSGITDGASYNLPTDVELDGVDGFTFVGWTTNGSYANSTTPPSPLYTTTITMDEDKTLYPVFSSGGSTGSSTTFSRINSTAVTAGYYVLSHGQNGENTVGGTLSYNKLSNISIDGGTGSAINATDRLGIWQIEASGTYWTVRNRHTGQYLAVSHSGSTINDNKVALQSSIDNYAKWSIVQWNDNYKFLSAADNTFWLRLNNGVWDVHQNGTLYPIYLYKYGTDPGAANTNYTINPTCSTVTLTYNGNNNTSGTVPAAATEYPTGTVVTVLGNSGDLARTGYDFNNWKTGASSGTAYTAGSSITMSQSYTLYAQWTAHTINLTLDKNGGETDGSASVKYDAMALEAGTTHVTGQTGQTLLGYYAAADGDKQVLSATGAFAGSAVADYITSSKWSRDESPTTLYAHWRQNTYTVVFNVNDGGGGATGSMSDQVFTYGTSQALTLNNYAWSEHNFEGWATSPEGEVVYGNGATVNNLTTTDGGTVNLYAVWTDKTYNDYKFTCVDIALTTEDTDPVYVTSRNGINIMAKKKLILTVDGATGVIDIASENNVLKFYKKVEGTGGNAGKYKYVELTGENRLSAPITEHEVYVSYCPTTDGTGDFVYPDITVTQGANVRNYENKVTARNLPEAVAIVAKVGDTWHALPANMTAATNPAPIPVSVALDGGVLKATGPSTVSYKLWPVKTVVATGDRFGTATSDGFPTALYGDRLRFAGNSNKALWMNNSTSANTISNDGAIAAVATGFDTDAAYEWDVTTSVVGSDFVYNLKADNGTNTYYLRMKEADNKWGTYSTGNTNVLYILPLIEKTPAELKVMEWGTNEIAVSYPNGGNATAITAKIGAGATSVVTKTSIGGDIYRLTGVGDLQGNPSKTLTLDITESGSAKQIVLQIPLIVTSEQTEATLRAAVCSECANQTERNKVAKLTDVIIRSGGKLTTGTASGDFKDLYIYPGGKADISLDFAAKNIYMRGGFSWLGGAYAHPQMNVSSGVSISGIGTGGVYYDLYLNSNMYYMTALPKRVNVSAMTNEENGNDWDAWVKEYSGEGRTKSPKVSGWLWLTTSYMDRGKGYEIAIAPRSSGAMNGRTIGILRFPLLKNEAWSDEATPFTPSIKGWGCDDDDVTDNNKGWNFLGNPFMTAYSNSGGLGGKMQTHTLVHHPGDPWNGTWDWVDSDVKYFTVPRFTEYEYDDLRAGSHKLEAFYPFFIQATGDGTVSFAASNKTTKKPSLYAQETEREVMVDIILRDANGVSDIAGVTISNQYSADFDMDDKEKTIQNGNATMKVYTMVGEYRTAFNSLPEAVAALPIPVGYIAPQAGKYSFSLVEEADYSEVEHVWLTDYETSSTIDLLDGDACEFETAKGMNNTRFALSIILKPESHETPTGLDEIDETDDGPKKFIYNDKMYILRNGKLYDATGKMVREINK